MNKHTAENMVPKFRKSKVYTQYIDWATVNLPEMPKAEAEARMARIWYGRSMGGTTRYSAAPFNEPNGFHGIDMRVVKAIKSETVAKYARLLATN